MKRFMKLMGVVLVLGAVATASTVGGNPEVLVNKNTNNPTTVEGSGGGSHCDPIEHILGVCRSSKNILIEN